MVSADVVRPIIITLVFFTPFGLLCYELCDINSYSLCYRLHCALDTVYKHRKERATCTHTKAQ